MTAARPLFGLVARIFEPLSKLRRLPIALAMIGLVVLAVPVAAVQIGPTLDWVPLSVATRTCPTPKDERYVCGLSTQQVNFLLRAQVIWACKGTKSNNPAAMNGWFLGRDIDHVWVNMHALVDKSGQLREPLNECYALSIIDQANYARIDEAGIEVGGNRQFHLFKNLQTDRARVPLANQIKGARALPFDPDHALSQADDKSLVMMVSANPIGWGELLVQICRVIHVADTRPVTFQTDCDNQDGISGALVLRPPSASETSSQALQPIGFHSASFEVLKPGANAAKDINAAFGISLGAGFEELTALSEMTN